MSTAQEKWEYFGETDPYWAVSTHEKFKSKNLEESAKDEFFQSGEDLIRDVWAEIKRHFSGEFNPEISLDFGCGVGRLVIPLASRSKMVFGVDISNRMLTEARLNSERKKVSNVVFQQTEEFLSANAPNFDLIHSSIVFQHIEPKRGLVILQKMLDRLNPGGVGVLQFTYKNPSTALERFRFAVYRDLPLAYRLRNLIKRQKNEPLMPMYVYNLAEVLTTIRTSNCDGCFLRFSDHGFYGATIYFQKYKLRYE